MGTLLADKAPATFDSGVYLDALLSTPEPRVVKRDRDDAHEADERAVSARIRSRRNELGLRLEDVVRLLEERFELRLSVAALRKWERGAFPHDRVTVLADVLEVSPEWILHGDAPQLADLQARLAAQAVLLQNVQRLLARLADDQETPRSRPA